MNNEISKFLIYQTSNQEIRVDVFIEDETIWMTQKSMGELFSTTPQNITLHLKNIYEASELIEVSTCKEFLQVQAEGERTVERKRKHYNLDAIISVGYRVNSARATQFRIWATRTLKHHLVQGYTLNQHRLKERGIEFEQVLALLSSTLINQHLVKSIDDPLGGTFYFTQRASS